MKRISFFFLMLAVFFLMQSTLLTRFSFFLVKPDLIFVFLILWAARCGPLEGAWLGAVSGLLVDSFGRHLPVYFLSYSLVGLLAGWLPLKFIEERIFEIVNWVFWFSLAVFIMQYLFLKYLTSSPLAFSFLFLIVSGFLNALAAPLIYPVFFWGSKK